MLRALLWQPAERERDMRHAKSFPMRFDKAVHSSGGTSTQHIRSGYWEKSARGVRRLIAKTQILITCLVKRVAVAQVIASTHTS
jgi:hypothetical protein